MLIYLREKPTAWSKARAMQGEASDGFAYSNGLSKSRLRLSVVLPHARIGYVDSATKLAGDCTRTLAPPLIISVIRVHAGTGVGPPWDEGGRWWMPPVL